VLHLLTVLLVGLPPAVSLHLLLEEMGWSETSSNFGGDSLDGLIQMTHLRQMF
jgi:hypothetical protein